MNTPNKITLVRLLLIPVIVFFYLAEFIPYARLVSAIVFVIACLTDFLDGYLARKNNQVTTLGKFFDSIADKILISTGLLLIASASISGGHAVASVGGSNWVALVCVIIIISREFIISSLRQIAASKGTVLAADMGGKIKATAQFVIVSIYMFLAFVETTIAPMFFAQAEAFNNVMAIIKFVLMLLLVATTILTIYTGASYLIRNRHVFSEDKEDDEIVKEINEEEMGIKNSNIENEKYDPLLPEALEIFLENENPSITLIQRKLSVGYPKGARIVDQMQDLGYVERDDNGRYKVLISKEEYNKIFKK